MIHDITSSPGHEWDILLHSALNLTILLSVYPSLVLLRHMGLVRICVQLKGRREKYKAAHQDEIDLYNNSKRVMKDNFGVTSLSVSTWQEEQKTLRRQNEELSTEYRPIREKVDKMLNVQHCVETARNANRSRQSNRQKNHQLLE